MTMDAFFKENRAQMIEDLKSLIEIESVAGAPSPGMPFGSGVDAVKKQAMALCKREGFDVYDADGHVAFAHLGPEDSFIGIMAHLDVVPADPADWDTPPFVCTERDGFLVGRGTGDNKGPFIMILYAMKYIKENGHLLRYGLRLIIGLDEETGMTDAAYYKEHFTEPAFLFTPDSDFPVCHGEKGILSADFSSPAIEQPHVRILAGGVASNVVPNKAHALLDSQRRQKILQLPLPQGVSVAMAEDGIRVDATGISEHAGTPEKGVSAIHRLLRFLMESGCLSAQEEEAAAFYANIAGDITGRFLGIDCDDGKFTPLTIIAGTLDNKDGRWKLNVNVRYPTAATGDEIVSRFEEAASAKGFFVKPLSDMPPYYLDPESKQVALLARLYNEATGSDEKPYVISGGTYARQFSNAVAFGAGFKNRNYPDWVGTAHMKNEAIHIGDMMLATEIYIRALIGLQEVDFS